MPETEMLADAELVALCRGGDRDAFGRIVERYQSLVCGLAYSACGDLNRSEDLAQETFLTAWRQLAALREPDKLKGWLCGIVRNLTRTSARDQSRNPLAAAVALEDEVAAAPQWEAPADGAMSGRKRASFGECLRLYRGRIAIRSSCFIAAAIPRPRWRRLWNCPKKWCGSACRAAGYFSMNEWRVSLSLVCGGPIPPKRSPSACLRRSRWLLLRQAWHPRQPPRPKARVQSRAWAAWARS